MLEINWSQQFFGITLFSFLFIIVFVWDVVWKFIAMWKAARKHSLAWFIILGVVNTIGILPILYICFFSKMKFKAKEEKPKRRHKRISRRKRR